MEIRKRKETDYLAAISRVYEESWRAAYQGLLPQAYLDAIPAGYWVPYLQQAGRECLLLLDGSQIVGTVSYCRSRLPELAKWGEIISIYLLPAYWGKGYGRMLFAAAAEELEKMGCQGLFLWVLEGNRRAERFYQRMGLHPHASYLEDTIGGMAVREVQYRREAQRLPQEESAAE